MDKSDIKIIYIFPPKKNKNTTSCVIEVPPSVHSLLKHERYIFINFSACNFSNYVIVVQCFKCLAFGHFARKCKSKATCWWCSGSHEMRVCTRKVDDLRCCNGTRCLPYENLSHSALDRVKCSFLRRKPVDRISNINYG